MRMVQRSLIAAMLMTAWCLPAPLANAQAQKPSQSNPTANPSARPSAPAPDLSDQKLDATAAALQRVTSLRQDYQQRVAAAQVPAEKERIVAEANDALTKAVTDQGLSVEEYASILDVARDNPEVRGKILERVQPTDRPSPK
jgi:HD-like signal output (HDOD) protein